MTEKKWKQTITDSCKAVGTYKPSFDHVIATAAAILAQRDKTWKEFRASGGQSLTSYKNKAGAENKTKNPLLMLWNDQNATALAYLRDLGLTPAGLKKLHEKSLQEGKKSAFEEVLESLG